jgi:hypothetical protein
LLIYLAVSGKPAAQSMIFSDDELNLSSAL